MDSYVLPSEAQSGLDWDLEQCRLHWGSLSRSLIKNWREQEKKERESGKKKSVLFSFPKHSTAHFVSLTIVIQSIMQFKLPTKADFAWREPKMKHYLFIYLFKGLCHSVFFNGRETLLTLPHLWKHKTCKAKHNPHGKGNTESHQPSLPSALTQTASGTRQL